MILYEATTVYAISVRGPSGRLLRKKVAGAMQHCQAKKLTKRCLYSGETKYLVLVKDSVEGGSQRSKSLEQEMMAAGIFDSDFSLGDLIDLDDASEGRGKGDDTNVSRKKLVEFPDPEGSESLQEYIGQYKKAALNKKALFKATKERLTRDECKGFEPLDHICGALNAFFLHMYIYTYLYIQVHIHVQVGSNTGMPTGMFAEALML